MGVLIVLIFFIRVYLCRTPVILIKPRLGNNQGLGTSWYSWTIHYILSDSDLPRNGLPSTQPLPFNVLI